MFFLLRMAFWLGLVLVLLPRDPTPEIRKGAADRCGRSHIGGERRGVRHGPVLQAAAGGLRGRRPGGDGDRPARPGWRPRGFYKIITDKKPEITDKQPGVQPGAPAKKPDHTGSIDAGSAVAAAPSADALTEDDMAIEWQMPRPQPIAN